MQRLRPLAVGPIRVQPTQVVRAGGRRGGTPVNAATREPRPNQSECAVRIRKIKYAVRPVTTNCVFCSVYSHKERIISTRSFPAASRRTDDVDVVGQGRYSGVLTRLWSSIRTDRSDQFSRLAVAPSVR